MQLGVLELDWPLEDPIHPALALSPPPRARGESGAAHALATAGLLFSREPDMLGLCPGAPAVLACPGADGDLAGALRELAAALPDGSILLIEATIRTDGPDLPAEHDPELGSIIGAHADRLVIVEPAGNSGIELDPDRFTSGAWRVGACGADGAWWGNSNYGKRVQLHAPGHGIRTLAPGSQRVDYRDTSAAAALVAGVAFQAQQLASARLGRVLRPTELLAWLRRTGSPQARSQLDPPVGIRPDLASFRRSLSENRTLSPRTGA